MEVESLKPQSNKNHPYKCICEMCSCGNHQCPPQKVKTNFQTSYNNHYKGNVIQISPQPPPYQYQPRHYNPQSIKTNYQETYLPQSQSNTRPQTPYKYSIPAKMVLNHVPFNGTTAYKQQYKPFLIEPVAHNPQQNGLKGQIPSYNYNAPVKFEGTSSYTAQYSPPKVQSKTAPYAITYKRLQVPFVGSSSYKRDYNQYRIEPVIQKNNFNYDAPKVQFQGESSYHNDYPGHYTHQQTPHPTHKHCEIDMIKLPTQNYINDHKHIYIDPQTKKLF